MTITYGKITVKCNLYFISNLLVILIKFFVLGSYAQINFMFSALMHSLSFLPLFLHFLIIFIY